MKRTRSLLFAASLVAMIAIMPTVRADTDTAVLVSARHGDISQVATADLAKFTDVLGKKGLNLDLKGFGGLTFDRGKLQGGLALSHRRPFSREAFVDLGLYGRFTDGRPADAGLFVSVGWRL